MTQSEWFQNWFNSEYYHILYAHRDIQESIRFIDALLEVLQPDSDAKMLDLACGKGRHARYLASKGYETTGLDLSEESIAYARQFEDERLSFFQHDMRTPFRLCCFDYVFNFFTSFGYFSTRHEHVQTLINIRKALREDGTFILDFLNVEKALQDIPREENVHRSGIDFCIQVEYDKQKIIKKITVVKGKQRHQFEERVWAFKLGDFKDMLDEAGLEINRTFGDYEMQPFNQQSSERLIIEAVHATRANRA